MYGPVAQTLPSALLQEKIYEASDYRKEGVEPWQALEKEAREWYTKGVFFRNAFGDRCIWKDSKCSFLAYVTYSLY
jgi:hypothetical protein